MSITIDEGESARMRECVGLRRSAGALLIGLGAITAGWAALASTPWHSSRSDDPRESIESRQPIELATEATAQTPTATLLDLGTIVIAESEPARLAAPRVATMQLTNDAPSARRIVGLRTSCGCVAADSSAGALADMEPISAGGSRSLDLTIQFAAAGPFHATVWVRWDDGRIDAHAIQAHVVRPDATLTISDRIVDDRRIVVVIATRDDSDPPSSPPACALAGPVPALYIGPWRPLDRGEPANDAMRQWICEYHLPRADQIERPTTATRRNSS